MSLLRSAAIALGWTTLALTGLIEPMVGRGKHLALYHWDDRASILFGPVLAVFALVWAGVTVLIWSARVAGRWRVAVWGALTLLLPWLLVNAAERLSHPLPFLRSALFALGLMALLWLLVSWRPSLAARFEQIVGWTTSALLALAFSGAVCLAEMGWFWWSARALNDPRPLHQAEATAALPSATAPGRVVWIVFDELSYRQLYERRFPGLKLPAFDALREQATVWTDVRPAGVKTDLVLPSFLTGQPVAAIRASAAGDLFFRSGQNGPWQLFPEHNNVFQDALNAGYRTGLAGWYNPYCRIMSAVLDHCFWRMHTELDNGVASRESIAANFQLVARALFSTRPPGAESESTDWVSTQQQLGAQGHLADFHELFRQSRRLLDDPTIGFVLLHLPVPHPEGIFDRRTGEFTTTIHTSYLDNLVLADQCLAELRAQLQQNREWDGATVVVMGDHSWRVNTMWRKARARWTPEEEAASEGGRFDDRPALLVKLPRQQRGAQIDTPFAAVKTRALLDELLARRLQTPDDLAAWVRRQ